MITTELVHEVRQRLGNRTDINDARIIRWLNWAMLDLCGFNRQRVFPSVWFHELEDQMLITVNPITGEVQDVDDDRIQLEVSNLTAASFVDSVIRVGGTDRLITNYDGAWAWIDPVEPEVEIGDGYSVHFRSPLLSAINIDMVSNVWAILEMEIASTGTTLEHVEWKELKGLSPTQIGTPQKYARHGNRILFDVAPAVRTAFRAFVYKFPAQLRESEPNRETDLPDQWDEVVVQGAVWRGFEALMEPERAMEAFEQFKSAATNRNSSYAVEAPSVRRSFKVRS